MKRYQTTTTQTKYKTFGEYMAAARNTLGLTQGQVAKKLGLNHSQSISIWERGTAVPRTTARQKIMKTLGLKESIVNKILDKH